MAFGAGQPHRCTDAHPLLCCKGFAALLPRLTAAQRAKAVKRRKEIWDALHPVKAQRFDGVVDAPVTVKGTLTEAEEREESGTTGSTLARPATGRGNTQFASETAEASGMTKQSINRHLARAEALGDDLDKVTGTSTLSRDSCFAPTEAPAVGLFCCWCRSV
jgi:hypothetical protein